MFDILKKRFKDAGTLQTLFVSAERHANAEGLTAPGAEHVVMAALEMPDATAREALLKVGASPEQFRDAVAQQYVEALRSVGIEPSPVAPISGDQPVPAVKGAVYTAHPSVQALMQTLTSDKPFTASSPLLSADILVAACAGQHTVAVRALRSMGIDPAALVAVARAEIAASAQQTMFMKGP